MKILKSAVIGLVILFVVAAIATATMIIKQNMIDIVINDSISSTLQNVKYKSPVKIKDDLFWQSENQITERTTNGVFGELIKQFPSYEVSLQKNLKNSELIDAIYTSLLDNMPVLCFIAAPDETESPPKWGVHFGLVVEMDIPRDKITLNEPYKNKITYSIRDFLRAARFDSYENTDLFFKLEFALEILTKNTVFIFEKKPE